MSVIEEAKTLDLRIKDREQLFYRQKETLDTFLKHGAISQAQYAKSLGDLKEKMGF